MTERQKLFLLSTRVSNCTPRWTFRTIDIKAAKYQFRMKLCVHLGHVVGNGMVQPEESKVNAVKSFPQPGTKHQVRGFLGLTGYYRRFIPYYAAIATPLMDLTKKTSPNIVLWDEKCAEAFERLKNYLCSNSVLRSPDFTKPFVLQTDASDRGAGAVLSQCDSEGDEHPCQLRIIVRSSYQEKKGTQQWRTNALQ